MSVIFDAVSARNALDALLAAINLTGGPTPGTIELRTGAAPAHLSVGATGTLLATLVFATPASPAFGAAAGTPPVATANVSAGWVAQDTSPVASGTVGYWRLYDHAGAPKAQGAVGTVGSGADIEFTTLSIVAGVLVRLNSFTMTLLGMT